MKLEVLIVTFLFVLFFGLNFIADSKKEEYDLMQLELNKSLENSSNISISNSDYILEQIVKNESSNKIDNLTNLNDDMFREELEKKNRAFVELVNES